MTAPTAPPEPVALLADRVPPRKVEEAVAQFPARRANLLRNWGMHLRFQENGTRVNANAAWAVLATVARTTCTAGSRRSACSCPARSSPRPCAAATSSSPAD